MKFTLKDIVFAAIIGAAMNVAGMFLVSLVLAVPLPGIRTVVIAPVYGLLLALAFLKIRKTGTATLVALFNGLVLGFMSLTMLALIVASGLTADVAFYLGKKKISIEKNIIFSTAIFLAATVLYGILFGALMTSQTALASTMTNPLLIGISTLVSSLLAVLGASLGIKIGKELQGISLLK